ncbi:MAG: divalent-cation tolerance protein CutA [Candidatus Marinarcus sp.]|uniref:divalent-cation tolerance protein CutA n=1 Tax=Candidatus Marinarcus sp. TaxID=3100987 RepID=UPI003AFF9E3A
MKTIIVQTTCANKKEAKNIAKILVKKRLAACVQMSKVKSIYRWNKELCVDKEVLLNIKTKKENFEKIQRKIKENHSYDLPEIIEIKITNASIEYLSFIEGNTK